VLEAADDEVHGLLPELLGHACILIACLLCRKLTHVLRVVLVCSAFQVEGVVAVDNLEQGLVLLMLNVRLDLLTEGLLGVVGQQLQLVSSSHQDHLLLSLQRPLG